MRILIAIFLLISLTAINKPPKLEFEIEGNRIDIPYVPVDGRETLYRAEIIQGEIVDGEYKALVNFTYNARLLMLEATAEGYLMRLTSEDMDVTVADPKHEELFKKIITIAEDIPVDYLADEKGTPIRVHNFEELSRTFKKVVAELERWFIEDQASLELEAAEKEAAAAIFQASMQPLKTMTPETGNDILLEEAVLLYGLSGGSFDLDNPLEYEMKWPVAAFGTSLNHKGTFTVESYSELDQTAIIRWDQSYDREDLQSLLAIVLEQVKEASGGVISAEVKARFDEMSDFDIRNLVRYTIDISTGEVLELDYYEIMTMAGKQHFERYHHVKITE